MTEAGLALMIAVASRDEFFDDVRKEALAAKAGTPLENTHKVSVRDGVAVVPVTGPLFRHANMMTRLSGATSYATLRTDLQAALDDTSVQAILLSIDSPGGDANGVAELAGAVRAATAKKPVVAYVGGTGASAAYWLASAASEIVASPTAELGSIGAVMAMEVEDEATSKKRVVFVSTNSPDKRLDPLSKAGRAAMQRRADDLSEVFVEGVAQFRGVTKADVLERFGRGGVMIASRAVAAGLADRVGDFESTLAALAGKRTSSPSSLGLQARGAQTMNKLIAFLGLAATASEDDVLAALKERDTRSAQALASVQTDAEEQKRINMRLEAGLKTLADDREARAAASWKATLAAKVDDFTISPAEAAEQEKLAGGERDIAARLLPLRPVGALKPAGKVVTTGGAVGGKAQSTKGTTEEGLSASQTAAVETFKKQNPGADDAAALMGAMREQPELFSLTEAV